MKSFFLRVLRDQHGQDLIEYALLTTFIAFAGIAVMDILMSAMNTFYGNQNTAVDNLWNPPAPSVGS